jgi:DNA-directed RNA polymerase subunit RPC12/RpoP
MKKGIDAGTEFYLTCKHCKNDYDLITAKREAKRTEPIRCPNCGCIVAR